MDIFTSLGLDRTLFIQMGVFLAVFLVLKDVLFKAYFAAFRERKERTVGQADAAERYVNEAKDLELQYSAKAQEINEQFRAIYDKTRSEATKEHDRVVQEARARSKQWIDEARVKVQKQIRDAQNEITPDIPAISQMITAKLLGKDIAQ